MPALGTAPDAMPHVRTAVARKPRPDPGPLRVALALSGMATASALITAFLAPSVGTSAGTVTTVTTTTVADAPAPSVRHVIQYVQLQPGQTAPPQAVVKQAPAPKPRVVVVTTRQSGK
jgi:hypothetical protein